MKQRKACRVSAFSFRLAKPTDFYRDLFIYDTYTETDP